MPVAVSPIDGHLDAVILELLLQCGNQLLVLVIDGAASVKVIVMLGHFQHAFARNVFAAQDVLQKWQHIFMLFRPAERDDQ